MTVTATDKGGHSIAEAFTIGVGDVNEAPLSLDLATTSAQLLINGSFEADKLTTGSGNCSTPPKAGRPIPRSKSRTT